MSLEKLMFTVALVDQITKPVQNIEKSLAGLTDKARQGFMDIGVGAAGLAASGFAIQAALGPALEMENALGEVRSLDVAEETLKGLSQTALEFSIQYGQSATDFVRSSYDIQSAIDGLQGNDLANFTKASNVLATATKADAGTVTNYVGTMYGIFKQNANAMGKSDWVEQLAGKTATAVQMFKTTGKGMSDAFTSIGANATASGVSMTEQMAILGQLQATMSGSEAGTKYKSFLAGVGGAQEKLGLQFTSSQGRLLPMLDILEKIKGKFGSALTEADKGDIKTAFGGDVALGFITQMMNDTDTLSGNLEKLGGVKGMDKATEMAASMTDPFERFGAGIDAIRISLGQALLPVLMPFIDTLTSGAATVQRWTVLFPNLTRAVGLAVIGVIGLGAAAATWTLLCGLSTVASVGWGVALATVNGVVKLMQVSMMAFQGVMWLVNAAMAANPVGMVILGLTALAAGVIAAVVYWDELKAAIADTVVFQFLSDTFLGLMANWDQFKAAIADTAAFQFLAGAVSATFENFATIWNWISSLFGMASNSWGAFTNKLSNVSVFDMLGDSIDWLIDKINLIPGIDIETRFGTDKPPEQAAKAVAKVVQPVAAYKPMTMAASSYAPGYQAMKQKQKLAASAPVMAGTSLNANVPAGGLAQTFNNGGAQTNYGGVTVNANNGITPGQLAEWEELQGP